MSYLDLVTPEKSLRSRIKIYRKRAREIEQYLEVHPNEWGRFQSEFNQEINGIFRDLMLFEKENLLKGREDKVYKLKQLFIKHFRDEFARGEYVRWSLTKPYGYAGDFKIIDDIYRNSPSSSGFVRLFDNYFLTSTISNAVRNRKEDFKGIVLKFIESKRYKPISIMDLAAGPCRDVLELLQHPTVGGRNIDFECFENDQNAIDYAKSLLRKDKRVTFVKRNALRIALKNEIVQEYRCGYDLIYATGLFDYLDYRVSVRLIANLRNLLNPGGILAISDVRDKFSNPSVYFMEWVGDWNLIYRDDETFRQIFLEAGFSEQDLSFQYEQQGLMQYIIARNEGG